jgi:hypothetical protein
VNVLLVLATLAALFALGGPGAVSAAVYGALGLFLRGG